MTCYCQVELAGSVLDAETKERLFTEIKVLQVRMAQLGPRLTGMGLVSGGQLRSGQAGACAEVMFGCWQ